MTLIQIALMTLLCTSPPAGTCGAAPPSKTTASKSSCRATPDPLPPAEIKVRWKRPAPAQQDLAAIDASVQRGIDRLRTNLRDRAFQVRLEIVDLPETSDGRAAESVLFLNGVALSSWLKRLSADPDQANRIAEPTLTTPDRWEAAVFASGMLAVADHEWLHRPENQAAGGCGDTGKSGSCGSAKKAGCGSTQAQGSCCETRQAGTEPAKAASSAPSAPSDRDRPTP